MRLKQVFLFFTYALLSKIACSAAARTGDYHFCHSKLDSVRFYTPGPVLLNTIQYSLALGTYCLFEKPTDFG